MNPTSLARAVLWLAALGLVVIVATRVVGNVGKRAGATL